MAALKLRRRHRLRRKEIIRLADELRGSLGCDTFDEKDIVEIAEAGPLKLILCDGVAYGFYIEEKPFLSIRGILKFEPGQRWVTVDMGAVKFLANGADVMSPGIVDADSGIADGDSVWIRDERNMKPLAVGVALFSGAEMKASNSGKSIKTLHYVGDKIWDVGSES